MLSICSFDITFAFIVERTELRHRLAERGRVDRRGVFAQLLGDLAGL